MLFDTHCHFNSRQFDEDLAPALLRMKEAGVARCTIVGDTIAASRQALAIAQENEGVYAACGVHPHEAEAFSDSDLAVLTELLSHEKAVALGEIGLDYYYDNAPRDIQKDVFAKQLALAKKLGKSVILHIRDAHDDALAILDAAGELPPCVVHCFTGSPETAKRYLERGFYISFTGVVTFKNAKKCKMAAQIVPDDRIMVETDAPYMAPEPLRGKRCESAFVVHTAKALAELRGQDYEAFCTMTTQNALRFYDL